MTTTETGFNQSPERGFFLLKGAVMIVYLLFVRGTFYKAFKDANKAYEWSQTHLDEEDKQDAWIVPEEVE